MYAVTFTGINDAIRARVGTLTAPADVIWWAQEYKPPVDRVHARWSTLPLSTVPMEVGAHLVTGDNPPDETRGILQFDVFLPPRMHPRDAEAVADAVRVHFRGIRSGPVQFETPRMLPVVREGDFTRHTIEIPWKAEEA